jgi:hypothetical protein
MFFTGDSCGLSLEVEKLSDLWFVTTQPWNIYSKSKKGWYLQVCVFFIATIIPESLYQTLKLTTSYFYTRLLT